MAVHGCRIIESRLHLSSGCKNFSVSDPNPARVSLVSWKDCLAGCYPPAGLSQTLPAYPPRWPKIRVNLLHPVFFLVMRLSILFAVFIILFHGVASQPAAARSSYHSEREASATTDPEEKARLIRDAEEHKQAPHGKGLGEEETKEFHEAEAAKHQAKAEFYRHKLMTNPEKKAFYEHKIESHEANGKRRKQLAVQCAKRAAAISFYHSAMYQTGASKTTDHKRKARFIRDAQEYERAAHGHLEGLGQEG